MKVYMHEYALDTKLLFSDEGRILGVYLDREDLDRNVDALPITEEALANKGLELEAEEIAPLDFDDAAQVDNKVCIIAV